MSRALSQRLEEEVPKRLAELLAVPMSRVKVQRQSAGGRGNPRALGREHTAGPTRPLELVWLAFDGQPQPWRHQMCVA